MAEERQDLFAQAWSLLEPWHNKGRRTSRETLNRLFREQLQTAGLECRNAPDLWEQNLNPRLETWHADQLDELTFQFCSSNMLGAFFSSTEPIG